MSLPRFPDVPDNLTCENSISQILTSIAMEEIGLSHILNAEGEKLQYVLGTLGDSRPAEPPSVDQILEVNESVKDMLQQVAFNQMFLSAKMSGALKAYQNCRDDDKAGGNCSGPAVKPPIEADKKVALAQPNTYKVVEKGKSMDISVSGLRDSDSSNKNVATCSSEGDHVQVNGISAGVAAIGMGSPAGVVSMANIQVRDPDKISEYTLKNGGKVFFEKPGQTKPCPLKSAPASASGQIVWTSLNPAIAEVNQSGEITSRGTGAALVVGTFTDTWGVQREVTVLVGVGVSMQGTAVYQ